MTRTISLSADALAALRTAEATDTTVRLTAGQIDRKVYAEVAKALQLIGGGGQWGRRTQLFTFPRDPRDELNALLGSETMPVDRDKELSYFATPAPLCALLVDRLRLHDGASRGQEILEPSAGDGAIVRALRGRRPEAWIDAVEIDPARAAAITGASEVFAVPFAEFAAATMPGTYDAVVMNPPFTEPGNTTAWVDHIDLAWTMLRPGGHLLAIAPASLAHSSTRRIAALRERVEADGSFEPLHDGAFKQSGTLVRTVLVDAIAT